jgi:hypothetical protein
MVLLLCLRCLTVLVLLLKTFDLSPDPRVLPGYYECISLPMDLETLRHRVQTFYYHSVEEFAKVGGQVRQAGTYTKVPHQQSMATDRELTFIQDSGSP